MHKFSIFCPFHKEDFIAIWQEINHLWRKKKIIWKIVCCLLLNIAKILQLCRKELSGKMKPKQPFSLNFNNYVWCKHNTVDYLGYNTSNSIMLWVCFSSSGPVKPVHIQHFMNNTRYIEILQKNTSCQQEISSKRRNSYFSMIVIPSIYLKQLKTGLSFWLARTDFEFVSQRKPLEASENCNYIA